MHSLVVEIGNGGVGLLQVVQLNELEHRERSSLVRTLIDLVAGLQRLEVQRRRLESHVLLIGEQARRIVAGEGHRSLDLLAYVGVERVDERIDLRACQFDSVTMILEALAKVRGDIVTELLGARFGKVLRLLLRVGAVRDKQTVGGCLPVRCGVHGALTASG